MRERRNTLVEIASAQDGFFTAAQAVQAGYSHRLQHLHHYAGNWEKVGRAVFRLPHFPLPSRVRDLADMVLLIQLGLRADGDLRAAIDATFTRRATHPVLLVVPEPPADWTAAYAQIAASIRLTINDAGSAHQLIAAFWERSPAQTKETGSSL